MGPRNMSADYNTRVQIHPAALAIIVDAHERRGKAKDGDSKKSYVIGTLMGNTDGNLTFIDQVFVVNYELCQDDRHGTVFQIDKTHQAEMLGLAQAATPDQSVVGWFSTANQTEFTELDKMLNGELTDLLMVTYLSQLANVQLTLNDKLKNAFAQTPQSAEKKIMAKGKRTNLN